MRTTKTLIRLRGCAGRFESSLGAHVSWYVFLRCGSFLHFVLFLLVSAPTYVSISKESHTTNSEVTRLITENPDYWVDNDFIRYTVTDDTQFIPWDYANISRVNDRLFYLNGGIVCYGLGRTL